VASMTSEAEAAPTWEEAIGLASEAEVASMASEAEATGLASEAEAAWEEAAAQPLRHSSQVDLGAWGH
jgi:hypothetical protein